MLIAVTLFALVAAVHIALGDFPKAIDVMPDERRYLDIARSLFAGEGLIIRGQPSDFQKIGYPLSLLPALLLPDGADQIRLMNVLNSLYAASTVFPALLIARRLFERPAPIIACMALAVISPDLMYSMTFMSESVFLPLSLWLIYLCWRCLGAHGRLEVACALGAGLLCYVTYLCKEVAWMYLIAFLACTLRAALQRRRPWRRAAIVAGAFLAGFFAPFAVMKLTLFAGLANSYSQFGVDILMSQYNALFGLYSLAVDAAYFVVGFGVFPVLYVALTCRDLPRSERDLAQFCLVALAVALVMVIVTISMREDVGHVALRQHLRYAAPLALPLLFLFMRQFGRLDPTRITASPSRLALTVALTAGFCGLLAGFFGGANLSQGFDNGQFHFLRWLLDQVGGLSAQRYDFWAGRLADIDPSDGELLPINPLDWAVRLALIAFTAVGMRLLLDRRERVRKAAGVAITCLVAALMLANSAAAYQYNRGAYGVDQDDVDEICTISDQLAHREGAGEVIVALDEANTGPNNLIDTYLQDGAGNYRYVPIDDLDGELTGEGVEYLLVNTRQKPKLGDLDVERIGGSEGPGARFNLYRIAEHPPQSST